MKKRSERYAAIIDYFKQAMPTVDTELHYGSPFQLLVAVVLSAQCTDQRVNQVTPALFERYPDVAAFADAEEFEIYEYIRSVSYPNAKAKHLCQLAKKLLSDYDGRVPSDMDALLSLPGVGRKTANVVQAVAFGKATMAVDTHVYRVAHRLGLVPATANTPAKVEQWLMKNIAEEDIPRAHHWLLLHGRYVCTSRAPHCDRCGISNVCPKRLKNSKLE